MANRLLVHLPGVFGLVDAMMIRSQWVYKERLTYPVIELPRAMVMPSSLIFRHRLFWTGFLIAVTITTINGLHSVFPAFPALPTRRRNINYLLTDPPWNALNRL